MPFHVAVRFQPHFHLFARNFLSCRLLSAFLSHRFATAEHECLYRPLAIFSICTPIPGGHNPFVSIHFAEIRGMRLALVFLSFFGQWMSKHFICLPFVQAKEQKRKMANAKSKRYTNKHRNGAKEEKRKSRRERERVREWKRNFLDFQQTNPVAINKI